MLPFGLKQACFSFRIITMQLIVQMSPNNNTLASVKWIQIVPETLESHGRSTRKYYHLRSPSKMSKFNNFRLVEFVVSLLRGKCILIIICCTSLDVLAVC